MESPSDAFAAAIRLHQAGRLAEAEALYRGVLERDPKRPGALHLLGAVAHEQGHDDRAAELITLAENMSRPKAHFLVRPGTTPMERLRSRTRNWRNWG